MRLRVLHVCEALGGGVLAVLQPLIDHGVHDRHEMALAYGIRPETPRAWDDVFPTDLTMFPPIWAKRSALSQVRGIQVLRQLVAQYRPDVIHAHSSFAGVASIFGAGAIPTIYTPHGFAFLRSDISTGRRAAFRRIEAAVAQRVTLLAGCSASEAEAARAIGAPRVSFVANGIKELNAFVKPAPRRPRLVREIIVASGRLSAQRQPGACARILGEFTNESDVKWIGGAGAGGHHRAALDAAGIPVTGWLPRESCLELLNDASIYLHWTAWDGLALSILEAFATDTVVVASAIAPNRELLDPRQTCNTERDAVTLIRRLLRDRDFYQELLQSQRQRASAYGAERMCREWMDTYRRVVRTRAPTQSHRTQDSPAPGAGGPRPLVPND